MSALTGGLNCSFAFGSRSFSGERITTEGVPIRRLLIWAPVHCVGGSKTSGQPRGPLWRSRSVNSKETVQAVHALRRSKEDPEELERAFQERIYRLLKVDMLATLRELQRQNEVELSLKVFDIVRKENWYQPDVFLYREMLDALGRNGMLHEMEQKFRELQEEGLIPDVYIYRELAGGYARCHVLEKALEVHKTMVELGCGDDKLTIDFINTEIRGTEAAIPLLRQSDYIKR